MRGERESFVFWWKRERKTSKLVEWRKTQRLKEVERASFDKTRKAKFLESFGVFRAWGRKRESCLSWSMFCQSRVRFQVFAERRFFFLSKNRKFSLFEESMNLRKSRSPRKDLFHSYSYSNFHGQTSISVKKSRLPSLPTKLNEAESKEIAEIRRREVRQTENFRIEAEFRLVVSDLRAQSADETVGARTIPTLLSNSRIDDRKRGETSRLNVRQTFDPISRSTNKKMFVVRFSSFSSARSTQRTNFIDTKPNFISLPSSREQTDRVGRRERRAVERGFSVRQKSVLSLSDLLSFFAFDFLSTSFVLFDWILKVKSTIFLSTSENSGRVYFRKRNFPSVQVEKKISRSKSVISFSTFVLPRPKRSNRSDWKVELFFCKSSKALTRNWPTPDQQPCSTNRSLACSLWCLPSPWRYRTTTTSRKTNASERCEWEDIDSLSRSAFSLVSVSTSTNRYRRTACWLRE